MQIVFRWEEGSARYQTDFTGIELERPKRCPCCGCGKFHKWGKYERYVIEEDVERRIPVPRIRCVKCLKTYSYLPSFCLAGICYGVDFVMNLLKSLLLKTGVLHETLKRRAYAFLGRFTRSENLWLVFLRAKGFADFPLDKQRRLTNIFTELLKFHQTESITACFLRETGRHFMSAK